MRTWLLASPSPLSRMLCPLSSISQHATLTLSFLYLSFDSLISPSGLLLFRWSEKVPGSNSHIFPAHRSHCHLHPWLLYPQPYVWVPASLFIKALPLSFYVQAGYTSRKSLPISPTCQAPCVCSPLHSTSVLSACTITLTASI